MTNSKKILDRYARLKNLKVVVPKVNPVLDHNTRGANLKIQNYQKALCTATYALTKIWQTIFTSDSPKIRGLMKGVADLIALIQKTNHDLSMDRRRKILNAQLNKKYRKLGSAGVPIAHMLFGNDSKAALTTLINIKNGPKFQPVKCKQKSEVFSTKHILCKKTGTGIGDGVQEKPGHPEAEWEDGDRIRFTAAREELPTVARGKLSRLGSKANSNNTTSPTKTH